MPVNSTTYVQGHSPPTLAIQLDVHGPVKFNESVRRELHYTNIPSRACIDAIGTPRGYALIHNRP